MQLYFYAKSGHTVGLEETKRCSAIANQLKEFNPILCTSDFRAGAFAKDNFGIKKYVNIDVVRNLHNIMQKGDILIYDTPEVNEVKKEEMKEYCSLLYGINDELFANRKERGGEIVITRITGFLGLLFFILCVVMTI